MDLKHHQHHLIPKRVLAVAVASAVAVGVTAIAGTASASTSTAQPLGWGKSKQPLELTASDGAQNDQFGSAVAVSGNGEVAVVGAPGNDNGEGTAYVFTKARTGWNQVAELTASDGAPGDAFGNAVALSRTGSTIVIGAVIHNNVAGSAYVFTRSGDSWTQSTELAPSSESTGAALFGVAVSISSDGSSVLVGAQGQGLGGAAYFFSDQGGGWTQTQVVTASDVGAYDAFGSYVALSGDGSTAVIGSPEHVPSGAAYVFVDSNDGWTQTDELTASDSGAFLGFGNRFAVSRTGSVIAVGAVAHNQNTGMTYVFTGSPGSYTQTTELTAKDSVPGDFFGSSVSMSHNGSVLAISADQKNVNTGAEYVFVRGAGDWSQKAELTAPDGAQFDYFGLSTALSADGSSLFVSSDYHAGSTGAVYVFTRDDGSGTALTSLR